MPYVITKGCEEKESFCIAACPFDCIQLRATSPRRKPRLSVDTELCTNCGACALVCPEDVFAPAPAGYIKGLSVMPTVTRHHQASPKPRRSTEVDVPVHSIMAPAPAAAQSHHVH